MNERIPATIVNHVAIDIAAPADAVWQTIIDELVEAKGFRGHGAVIPLSGPDAPLGGYRVTFEDDDGALDERVARITERDNAARRLSICADFLSVPGGMRVYATYHAQDTAGGARFAIDCHTCESLDVAAGAGQADVAASVAKKAAFYDRALAERLQKTKERLEGAQ